MKNKMNLIKKKPKLLLINPWIYDFTAYDFWSKPLGLLHIASILRKIGYEIDYIDCMDRYDQELLKLQERVKPENDKSGRGPFYKTPIPRPEILKSIPRNYSRYGITEEIFFKKLNCIKKPDAILVTSIMTYWYPGVFKVIELVKKYYPDCPVILGGVYATLCYKHAISFSGADFILKNYQMLYLLELLAEICEKPSHSGEFMNNFLHFPSFSYPAWDLYSNLDYICLITVRGCPFRCSYCASYLLNSKVEFRGHSSIIEEIVQWKEEKGIHNFVFYDDALLLNSETHFIPLMELLKKRNLNINFYTPNALHARYINRDVTRLMMENGFKKIWLGFETSDIGLQRKTGGKIDNSGFKRAVKNLLRAGFLNKQICAYILVGLPGQNFESIIDSVRYVIDTGVKPYLAKFSPIPGTKIWSEAIKDYGLTEPVDPLWHNDALMPYNSPYINQDQYQQIKTLIQNFR
jgi:radical SAM superfamily enzyme YgiQ (UPF0313 family)